MPVTVFPGTAFDSTYLTFSPSQFSKVSIALYSPNSIDILVRDAIVKKLRNIISISGISYDIYDFSQGKQWIILRMTIPYIRVNVMYKEEELFFSAGNNVRCSLVQNEREF